MESRIGEGLRLAYQNLNREFRKRLTQESITTHQFVVLSGLEELGEAIQRTLAAHCAIEPSNMNVMVKRMKEEGLIRSVGNSPGNRDAYTLTQDGRAVLGRLKKLDEETTKEFLTPLSRAEADSLQAALKKLG